MADRARNPQFGRRWTGPPPLLKRNDPRGQAGVATGRQKAIDNDATSTAAVRAAQRAVDTARRRSAELDRLADRLLHFGYVTAAERLSRRAAELRRAVLA